MVNGTNGLYLDIRKISSWTCWTSNLPTKSLKPFKRTSSKSKQTSMSWSLKTHVYESKYKHLASKRLQHWLYSSKPAVVTPKEMTVFTLQKRAPPKQQSISHQQLSERSQSSPNAGSKTTALTTWPCLLSMSAAFGLSRKQRKTWWKPNH